MPSSEAPCSTARARQGCWVASGRRPQTWLSPAEIWVMPGRLGIPWFSVYPVGDEEGEFEDRD